jgi:hypothetical protein
LGGEIESLTFWGFADNIKHIMTEKKKTFSYVIVGVIVVLVIAAVTTVLWQKKKQEAIGEVATEVNIYRDLQANMIGLAQRPYIQLLPLGNGSFTLRLNTLPLSAGEAEARVVLPDGKEAMAAHRVEFGIFPVSSEITYKGSGTAFLSTAFTGAPSYLVNQNFIYLTSGIKNITSGDGRFILQSEDLKNVGDILVMNSAGLPSTNSIERQVVSMSDPVNPDGASVPVAYQITSSKTMTVGELEIVFNVELPTTEVVTVDTELTSGSEAAAMVQEEPIVAEVQMTIYGYDGATKRWTALETNKDNNIYRATSGQMYDIFALMQ